MTQTRVYVDRGTLVYKFNLSWDENSRKQKSFGDIFGRLLSTVKFLR